MEGVERVGCHQEGERKEQRNGTPELGEGGTTQRHAENERRPCCQPNEAAALVHQRQTRVHGIVQCLDLWPRAVETIRTPLDKLKRYHRMTDQHLHILTLARNCQEGWSDPGLKGSHKLPNLSNSSYTRKSQSRSTELQLLRDRVRGSSKVRHGRLNKVNLMQDHNPKSIPYAGPS